MESQKELGPGAGGRRRRWLTLAAVLVVLAAGTLITLNLVAGEADGAPAGDEEASESQDEGKAPVPVEVVAVRTGPVSAYLTASANLVAEDEVLVLSEIEGRVSRVEVDEGDRVRRGQPLAYLVRDDQEIALNKARLKESNARLAYERGRDLMDKELISREDFDRFTMESQIASQELEEARWNLEKTTFRAPFDGRVSDRMVRAGQHLRPGDPLFRITDFDPLIARIYLPERDVLALEEGQAVRIRLAADEGVELAGRIRQISPVVDTTTGTVKVTVEAIAPPAKVRPGSFVTIAIVRQTRGQARLVPREAVVRELQRAHVFVATDDTAVRREVELGLEEGEVVEVTTGVDAGELVIVAGQGGLKDGSAIKVLEAGAAAG